MNATPFLDALSWEGHLLVGEHRLAALRPPAPEAPDGRLPFARPAQRTLVALDIETTGLTGAGSMVFLVGLAQIRNDVVHVIQLLAPDLPWEGELLALLHALLADVEGALLVTFNGDVFDLPFLRMRARLNRVALSLPEAFDLLPTARRLYRSVVDSCRLTALEGVRLGHRRADDLPGALVPQTYYTALRTGDRRHLEPVLQHNALDLAATLALTGAVAEDLAPDIQPVSPGLHLGRARVHAAHGNSAAEEASLLACLAQEPAWHTRALALRRLDRLYRGSGRTVDRHRLWAAEAARPDCPPEHLVVQAKILEHEVRDLAAAYAVTLEAMARSRARARLMGRPHSVLEAELRRRLDRLARRLEHRVAAVAGTDEVPLRRPR